MLDLLPQVVCVGFIVVFLVVPAWARMQWREWRARREHDEAVASGRVEPVTILPHVDPGRCMGSGACVTACPEQVLRVIDGQAAIVDGAACVGHGACVAVCPVQAIELVFGSEQRGVDLPEVGPDFQTNVPGLFVAGELGGMGLIANAVAQGDQALDHAAAGLVSREDRHDVVIVGAGPAGLAAAAGAEARGLRYVVLEQEELGGAIRHYPRQKLVFSRPMVFRGHGRIGAKTMVKEELVAALRQLVDRRRLRIRSGVRVDGVTALPDGGFELATTAGVERAQRVILAVGRRGTPKRLGVPGEDQEKVAYWLTDAALYRNVHVLVVGGGDSAVEAAVALGEQPGNRVWLSYRRDKITRPKKKNLDQLREAVRRGRVELVLSSEVVRIGIDRVTLAQDDDEIVLPNDFVFAFVGGVLPTGFLTAAGVRIRTHFGKRVAEPSAADPGLPTPRFDDATLILPTEPLRLADEVTAPRIAPSAPQADPGATALRPREDLARYLASLSADELTATLPVDPPPDADEGTQWVKPVGKGALAAGAALERAESAAGRGAWDVASSAFEEAVELANVARDGEALRQALGALGRALDHVGQRDLGERILEEAWVRATTPAEVRATALRATAALALGRGRLDDAEARLAAAWDEALALGSADAEARACRALAELRIVQGQLGEAAELLARAERVGTEQIGAGSADVRVLAAVLARRIDVHAALGRYGAALRDGEALLELARRHRLATWLPGATARLGLALLAVGFVDVAADAAGLALDALDRAGTAGWAWRARLDVVRVLVALGRADADRVLDALGAAPESPLDDPPAQVAALRARSSADAARAVAWATSALDRTPPLDPIRAARIHLDAALALLAAGETDEARRVAKRGLERLQDTDAHGARLELMIAMQQARPDDRVADGIRRLARRVLVDLPPQHAEGFRGRPVLVEVLG